MLDIIASRLNGHAVKSWSHCVFTLMGMLVDSLDFSRVVIDGIADFTGCRFGDGKVSFAGAQFSGHTVFADCAFSGGALDSSHAQFDGDVTFSESVFDSGSVSFAGAQFGGTVNFNGCAFSGRPRLFRLTRIPACPPRHSTPWCAGVTEPGQAARHTRRNPAREVPCCHRLGDLAPSSRLSS
ncbi:pentapeptide repeat-containing protein [Amycolatopsis plumensis]|uniref:Pentapeptide repeat-containing protein n=1 Tax=Amycolatopsis plumensis TaxID=236508 RepID=A0ABV5U3S3_9PSEU